MDQAQLMWPIPLMRKHSLPPAVVHHACAKANFSLVHEIGHLIGASHERGYVHGNEWPRLPVWSNPDVLIGGAPAGSVGHDNARVIADNVLRVAAFR
jgi:hypothetical protein